MFGGSTLKDDNVIVHNDQHSFNFRNQYFDIDLTVNIEIDLGDERRRDFWVAIVEGTIQGRQVCYQEYPFTSAADIVRVYQNVDPKSLLVFAADDLGESLAVK